MKDEVINKLLAYLQSTEDFLLEQAPIVIQQLLRYKVISTWFYAACCIVGLIAFSWIGLHVYFHPQLDKYNNREFVSVF